MNDLLPMPWICWSCTKPQDAHSKPVIYGSTLTCRACEAEAQATIDATAQATFGRAFVKGAV